MATPVEQIKERLNIIDVVASYVQLQKAGKHYKGKSPFTSEKTPSFFVSPDRGMYYCFSSSKGGDIFTFIEEMEGVDFKGALAILAERAGVELKPEDPKTRSEREMLYEILEEATKFFASGRKETSEADTYLKDRGVTPETAEVWRIGFARPEWRALKEHLMAKGFSEALVLRAGLIKKRDEGQETYDVFRDRVMFPIMDASGRVVAFSGRIFGKHDENTPKYVNSPETELYNKSEILFGYHKAKQGIRSLDFSLIVEGQFDLVLAHQAGYTNTVAISGTSMTPYHVQLLGRLSDRSVLALDADSAGINSIKRAATLMLGRGMDIKVAEIPNGKDPADLVAEDKKKLKEVIGKAVHVVPFLMHIIQKETKDERTFRLRVRDEVLPFLVLMPSKVDQEYFEEIIAKELQSTKDSIHFEVERLRESSTEQTETVSEHTEKKERTIATLRDKNLAEHLFGLLLWLESVPEAMLDPVDFRQRLEKSVGEEVLETLESLPKDEQNRLIFEAERVCEEHDATALSRIVDDLLQEVSRRRLVGMLRAARAELAEAERMGDASASSELLGKCTDIQKELTVLERGLTK